MTENEEKSVRVSLTLKPEIVRQLKEVGFDDYLPPGNAVKAILRDGITFRKTHQALLAALGAQSNALNAQAQAMQATASAQTTAMPRVVVVGQPMQDKEAVQ